MATFAQLKAFHALALEHNFHRAAERLHLTQPAVSIQVKKLEQDSGRSLFLRNGHGVALTDEGRSLFELTTRIFDAEAQARQMLDTHDKEVPRTLHLGADGPHVALDLIAKVQRHDPGIRFRVSLANAETTWQNLLSMQVDAAVMANSKTDQRVFSQTVATQDLLALIPVDHVLSSRKTISFKELARCSLIFREHGSNTQQIVDSAFSNRDLVPKVALVMGSREGVREAVARGLGIGFGFDRELGCDPRFNGVTIPDFERCNKDMLLCLRKQKSASLVKTLFAAAQG
jgi:DNA-binding transcriptional LysR family regulator